MPRTLDDGALKSALAQRPTQVGAGIVETIHLPADLEQRVRPLIRRNALRTALRYLALHPQDCAHGPSRGRTCSSRCRWSTALGAGRHRGAGGRLGDLLSFRRPLHRECRGGPAGDDLADGVEEFGPDERLVFRRPVPALPRRELVVLEFRIGGHPVVRVPRGEFELDRLRVWNPARVTNWN